MQVLALCCTSSELIVFCGVEKCAKTLCFSMYIVLITSDEVDFLRKDDDPSHQTVGRSQNRSFCDLHLYHYHPRRSRLLDHFRWRFLLCTHGTG